MTTESIALENTSVFIGIPIDNDMPKFSVMSLCSTVDKLARMNVPYDIVMEVSGVIQMGRDSVLDSFLRSDKDKLFWIDSDMVWTPDDFLRLLALSTKVDVVGCAYPAKVEGPSTFYVNLESKEIDTGPYGLLDVKGMGLGFTVVDRKVVEKLAENAPKVHDQINKRDMAAVFRVDIVDGVRRTEDMAFFADIKALGYKVWCDASIELGHTGEKTWRAKLSDALTQQST
jgi:hypothetical protein